MIRQISSPKIELGGSRYDRPIAVDMQRWFEFNFWLAEELLDLVAEYELAQKMRPCQPMDRR